MGSGQTFADYMEHLIIAYHNLRSGFSTSKEVKILYCGVYATNKTGSRSDDWIY
jgi:hypothetical protein